MKTSERMKDKAKVEILRRRSRSYVEDGFSLLTPSFILAAVCNKRLLLEVPLSK